MRIRSVVAGVALSLAMLGIGGAVQARDIAVEIGVAPPPERVEVVPAPRPGYIYERGHYTWDGRAYVWSEGRFIEERPGHVYAPPVIEHRGEHYYFRSGHWDDD
jgi:YXWGXW repeat-containing protein